MNPQQHWMAQVDGEGRLVIPAELAGRFGLKPGAEVRLDESLHEIRIRRPVMALARLYLEVTNSCNLDCLICMRSVWDEPPGVIAPATFERLLEGLRAFSPSPTVFIGGFGEPLLHPEIVTMVRALKNLGAQVELITNGVLLTEERSQGLIQAGLDGLWVSIDGATAESYADVRLGAALPDVIRNLERFNYLRGGGSQLTPEIGIAFVAMKRNIADLPEIIHLGQRLGASRYHLSNLLAHTPELSQEILYERSIDRQESEPSVFRPSVSLPRIDFNAITRSALEKILGGNYGFIFTGREVSPSTNTCPFIEKGSAAIRWDGALSPCLPLLHTHTSFLESRSRQTEAYAVGNILERNLLDLWNEPAYVSLREKIQAFDFSPCTTCNSCDLADNNLEDCLGNTWPACGGCLWAQGLIQCP